MDIQSSSGFSGYPKFSLIQKIKNISLSVLDFPDILNYMDIPDFLYIMNFLDILAFM